MIKTITTLTLLLICSYGITQINAVTEHGDTIYVYDDGTWSFEMEEYDGGIEILDGLLEGDLIIDTIKTESVFSSKANKEIRTEIDQFVFKYNEKEWKRMPPAAYNEDAEFAFENRDKDIWAIIVTEETEIGNENIFKIAKKTMEENVGEEVTIKNAEVRNVNGHEVLRGTLETSISGIVFTFDTYYYSDSRGTTQITTWTSTTLWHKYEDSIIEFLNGVVMTN